MIVSIFNAVPRSDWDRDGYIEHFHPMHTRAQKPDAAAIRRAGVRLAESRAEVRARSARPPELSRRIG